MSDLLRHVRDDNFWELFEWGEATHATRFLYTAILVAARDEADTLIIRVNHLGFKSFKASKLLEIIFWADDAVPIPGYDVVLRKVLERDAIVREHLTIIIKTDEEITVRID